MTSGSCFNEQFPHRGSTEDEISSQLPHSRRVQLYQSPTFKETEWTGREKNQSLHPLTIIARSENILRLTTTAGSVRSQRFPLLLV